MGCWFCAFATGKLTKNFDYEENRDFFRKVVQSCVDLLGRDQAAMTLLYYGTEPHDNPHYPDFLKDHAEITGHATFTSTGACTDGPWLRKLIAYYRERLLPWPRLSVLSRKMLHELYMPQELRDVSLLMQMKDYRRCKVTGGRILKEAEELRQREEGRYLEGLVPQGSIDCVTGFLINMVRRRVQLVSPCNTSMKWPYGYRVFDEIFFNGPEDFEGAVLELIERSVPLSPPPQRMARLRDDLVYRKTDEGFDLVSPNQVRHFKEKELYGPLGDLLTLGDLTFEGLYQASLDEYGLNPRLAVGSVREMFDKGIP